jgi:hypothetical protein
MHNSLWGYLLAMAVGGMSQFIKDQFPSVTWLGPTLFWLAVAIALVATLGLMYETGRLQKYWTFARSWRFRVPWERVVPRAPVDWGQRIVNTPPPLIVSDEEKQFRRDLLKFSARLEHAADLLGDVLREAVRWDSAENILSNKALRHFAEQAIKLRGVGLQQMLNAVRGGDLEEAQRSVAVFLRDHYLGAQWDVALFNTASKIPDRMALRERLTVQMWLRVDEECARRLQDLKLESAASASLLEIQDGVMGSTWRKWEAGDDATAAGRTSYA